MSLRKCCDDMSYRKDLILVEEVDKSGNPIKESVLSKDRVVSSESMQMIALPGGRDTRQRAKHRRNINLPSSGEYK